MGLIHGNINKGDKWVLNYGHFTNLAKIFVWGTDQKKILKENYDTRNSDIVDVGSPLFINTNSEKKDLLEEYTDKKLKTILYAVGPKEEKLWKKIIGKLNLKEIEYKQYLKPHPACHSNEYRNIDCVTILNRDLSLERFIPKSNIFITAISTSIIQAMMQRVPVFIYSELSKHMSLNYSIEDIYSFNENEKRF